MLVMISSNSMYSMHHMPESKSIFQACITKSFSRQIFTVKHPADINEEYKIFNYYTGLDKTFNNYQETISNAYNELIENGRVDIVLGNIIAFYLYDNNKYKELAYEALEESVETLYTLQKENQAKK